MTELITPHKMSFLEKFSVLAYERKMHSCAVSAMVHVQGHIDFALFKKAWHVLFQRQPLLRSTARQAGQDYFFDFNAHFDDIPIKLIETDDTNAWDQEYSRDIFKGLALNQYCWRTTLIKIKNTNDNYIIFASPHQICDGKSLASLLGELLRILIMLKKNENIDTTSLPVPPSLNDALNRSFFTPPAGTSEQCADPWHFQQSSTIETVRSENILRVLPAEILTPLLAACRRHKTTITNAISAAYALSLLELQNQPSGPVDLFTAVNFRPYTKSKLPDNVLAFYAHQVLTNIDVATNQTFWTIAQQAQEKFKQAFPEYQPPHEDDNSQLTEDAFTHWQACLEQQKFMMPCLVSNVGVIDAAFENIDHSLAVKSFNFTLCIQGIPYALIIFSSTLNNTVYFDFNFASPAIQSSWVTALADKMFEKLKENINA